METGLAVASRSNASLAAAAWEAFGAQGCERFEREARVLAGLVHPGRRQDSLLAIVDGHDRQELELRNAIRRFALYHNAMAEWSATRKLRKL